jgi:hypothetical protein
LIGLPSNCRAEAQKECDLGRVAKGRAVRLAHFQKGQALAERAMASDDQLADAHFALFCSLGEQMRIDREPCPGPPRQYDLWWGTQAQDSGTPTSSDWVFDQAL